MIKPILCILILSIIANSSYAFQTLPTDGSRVDGGQNLGRDPLFVIDGGLNFNDPVTNDPVTNDPVTNDPVTNGPIFSFNLPANFVLEASRVTTLELPDETTGIPEEVGEFTDAVFRNTNTGTLIFGSRIVLEAEELFDPVTGAEGEFAEAEINDILRTGFANTNAQVGWTRATSSDLRLFSAAFSTASGLGLDSDDEPFDVDLNTVSFNSDINGEEGNAFSGWYLIATDATEFSLTENAAGVFQAGEEGQDPTFLLFDGYTPADAVVSALTEPRVFGNDFDDIHIHYMPVPAAVWLFGSALVGLVGIRRKA